MSNLTKKYVDEALSNLSEFYINPKKKLRVELYGQYEIAVPEYLYCYYQAFPRLKMKSETNSIVESLISMFGRRTNFYSYPLEFRFSSGVLKSILYYDKQKDRIIEECDDGECLSLELMNDLFENVEINNPVTYFVFPISFRDEIKSTGHANVAIYEYNSVDQELCSVYYEPHGHSKISKYNLIIRKQLDAAMSRHCGCEATSLPFEHYLQSIGFQANLKDDLGFCIAISNLWLYVVLNIIYSKSFSIRAKKIKKSKDESKEYESNQPLIVMGNKRLLSSREKYLERVKVQRKDLINSNFNTLSMCHWIQDVEKHIIDYYNKDNNILYNFLFMIVQYMMINVSVNFPAAQNLNLSKQIEKDCQKIFNEALDAAVEINLNKGIDVLKKIPKEYMVPYALNFYFLINALKRGYLKPIKLGDMYDDCEYDYDCNGNLECINNMCDEWHER